MTGTTTNNNPRYVLFDDVVSLTGLSPSTIRRRIREGKIISHQPGGPRTRRLFDATTLGLVAPVEFEGSIDQQTRNADGAPTLSGPKPKWLE